VNHLHWRFLAYDGPVDAKEVRWAVTVTVLGYRSEETASKAAAEIVQRDNYTLQAVWECNECSFRADQTKALTHVADKM
jgi:hypothetical protein